MGPLAPRGVLAMAMTTRTQSGHGDPPNEHDALRGAVVAIDEGGVRRSRAADAPAGALAWPGRITDRFMLIDHFERDGRRFLVAVDSRPGASRLLRLSLREREVLHHAMRGSSNKEIGSDLGLSDSTVRVLIWRAARKLGVRTRAKLIAFAARLLDLAEPVEPTPSRRGDPPPDG